MDSQIDASALRVIRSLLSRCRESECAEELVVTFSLKNNRPTAKGALAEVLLLLAVGFVVIGVCCGWFAQSGERRMESRESR
jgi:hypothetical protein